VLTIVKTIDKLIGEGADLKNGLKGLTSTIEK
jgi:hypothetical protein